MKLNQLTKSISLALIASSSAQSAEFIVTTNGDDGGGVPNERSTGVIEIETLRLAIELADDESAFPGVDVIRFDHSLLSAGLAEIGLYEVGDMFQRFSDVSNSALGINSEIIIKGFNDGEMTLKANNLRHFQVNAGGRLQLNQVTLDGGFAPDNFAGSGGAVMVLNGGSLSINDSVVSNNTAYSGGAIYTQDNSLTSNITNTRFSNNTTNGELGSGGAINHESESRFIIKSSVFENNQSNYDGGALSVEGPVIIESSVIINNTARIRGGGISIFNDGVLTLVNSTISNNRARTGQGGGIEIGVEPNVNGSYNTLINSTITHNQARSEEITPTVNAIRSGGIYFDTLGGGVFAMYEDTVLIHNTLISNNTELTTQVPDDVAAKPIVTSSHNLIGAGDSVIGLTDGMSGNQIGTESQPIDAQLLPLANNGGATLTQLVGPSSPVIDAGNNTVCTSVDQRGFIRPSDGDADGSEVCDIGAVELGGISDLIFSGDFEQKATDLIFSNGFDN